jgi:hypothetical protein
MEAGSASYRPTFMTTKLPVSYRKRWLVGIAQEIAEISSRTKQLIGCEVRIVSGFNGQPYGRSKAAKTGKVYKIASIYMDEGGVSILLEGFVTACGLEDIKFI